MADFVREHIVLITGAVLFVGTLTALIASALLMAEYQGVKRPRLFRFFGRFFFSGRLFDELVKEIDAREKKDA